MPVWRDDGKELFYVSAAGALMRVGVESGATWARTPPTHVIGPGYLLAPPVDIGRSYDISSDGQRFLVVKDSQGIDNTSSRSIIDQRLCINGRGGGEHDSAALSYAWARASISGMSSRAIPPDSRL